MMVGNMLPLLCYYLYAKDLDNPLPCPFLYLPRDVEQQERSLRVCDYPAATGVCHLFYLRTVTSLSGPI